MANISAIKLPNNTTYNLVDKTSGYITSYTDEKLKVEVDDGNQYYPVLTSSSTTASTKKYSNLLNFTTYSGAKCLAIGGTASDSTKKAGALRLFNDAGGSVTLKFDSTATYSRSIIIPNKSGSNVTLATLQDIPTVPTKVSAFTNDAGYITSYTETDPIFTSSVAHGISASDIANWNGKQAALVSGTNIKTINNTSLLGSGDITISGGAEVLVAELDSTPFSDIQDAALSGKAVFVVTTDGDSYYGLAGLSTLAVDEYALFNVVMYDDSHGIDNPNIAYIFVDSNDDWYNDSVDVQKKLVSGSNIKTVNSTSLVGSGNVSVQPTLVSGTNIKTINNTSLLGSGNITIEDASNIKLYYESGDSITYGEYESGLVITGFVTSSKKEDHYTIPLSKPCTASTVTITNFGVICRQDANYVHGTGATTYKTPSYTATLTGQDSDGAYTSIKLICTWSNTTNVVNNAPIAANIRGVFTFS